jgi:hypothetical protein
MLKLFQLLYQNNSSHSILRKYKNGQVGIKIPLKLVMFSANLFPPFCFVHELRDRAERVESMWKALCDIALDGSHSGHADWSLGHGTETQVGAQ